MEKLYDKAFWYATLSRAIRTACQTAIASIGTASVMAEVKWPVVLSTVALASIVSVLMSIVMGIPEVED